MILIDNTLFIYDRFLKQYEYLFFGCLDVLTVIKYFDLNIEIIYTEIRNWAFEKSAKTFICVLADVFLRLERTARTRARLAARDSRMRTENRTTHTMLLMPSSWNE